MPAEPQISLARLSDLLVEPREHLHVEIKEWLDLSDKAHRANLAKEIIALANHGGGFILLGFREAQDSTFAPATPRPANLDGYSQDVVNDIVRTYIDPSIHCSVHHEVQIASGERYPIIVVPGGHRQPVMAKRGSPDNATVLARTVYCRRAGPVSEQPQSSDEWRDLMDRCLRNGKDDLLDAFRNIMSGGAAPQPAQPSDTDILQAWINESLAQWEKDVVAKLAADHVGRFPLGHYEFAYIVLGDVIIPDLNSLLQHLEQARGHHTGWPCWWVPSREGISPYPSNGAIECALALDTKGMVEPSPHHSDFWRSSPQGKLFLIRGYDEDSYTTKVKPGTGFDITTPTWRLGDALLHASRFATAVAGEGAEVLFRAKWTGLSGRQLVSVGNPMRVLFNGHTCRQASYTTPDVRLRAAEIPEGLPEIVDRMVRPLYELFDFFQLPATLTAEELATMRANRF